MNQTPGEGQAGQEKRCSLGWLGKVPLPSCSMLVAILSSVLSFCMR